MAKPDPTTSTATVLFRALVMLSCLVAVPLMALSGRSFPEVLDRVLSVRWPWQNPPTADRFQPMESFEPAPVSQASMGGAPTLHPADNFAAPLPTTGIEPQRSHAIVDPGVVPAEYQVPSGVSGPSAVGSPVPRSEIPDFSTASDPFTAIQNRLQDLGATYYLLESIGGREPLHRFFCKVSANGDPNYTHYFEASDADQLRAMQQVLDQVVRWRATQR